MDNKIITNKLENKQIYIELLRICACFLVIVCHTYSWNFDKQVINFNWFINVAIYFISKIAVPIFFMISGYLLLRKDYTYKQILNKILFRIVIPLFVFSAVIYFKENLQISINNILMFLKAFLSGKIIDYYWFLYTLIGLYIMTPFLKKFIKNFNKKDYYIFFSIWLFIYGILPILENYLGFSISSSFSVPIVSGYIGYYILGYYILDICKPKFKSKKMLIIICCVLFIVSIFLCTFITYIDYKKSQFNNYSAFLDKLNYISIVIPSVTFLLLIRCIFENKLFDLKSQKIICTIASTTFGIYLIHGKFVGKFEILYDFFNQYINSFLACYIVQLIMLFSVGLVVWLLKKIPLIKKLL